MPIWCVDGIDGIAASINPSRKLEITSESPLVQFSFADDTSGVLAALGINTFFSGSDASNIGISDVVRTSPGKFSASLGGVGEDTDVAARLANLLNTQLPSQGNESLATLYDRMTSEVTQGAAVTHSVAEGFRVFQRTLEGQHLAISGVNLDEEAVRMITFQRAFQASARLVSIIDELFTVLLEM